MATNKRNLEEPNSRANPKRKRTKASERLAAVGNNEHYDNIDVDALMEEAERTTAAAEARKTVNNYKNLLLQMHEFLARKFNKRILEEVEGQTKLVDKPTIKEFKAFLQYKIREKPDMRNDSLKTWRAAINKWIDLNSINVDTYSEKELKNLKAFLKGAKNNLAEKVQKGELSSFQVGKDHLTIYEYSDLCLESLRHLAASGRNHAELHLFIVLSWCLLSREETTMSYSAKHLDWEGDALIFSVSSTKRNKAEKPDKYRVYPNPFLPHCCPVLAIALACACDPTILGDEKQLFHYTEGGEPTKGKKGKKGDKTNASAIGRQFSALCNMVWFGCFLFQKTFFTDDQMTENFYLFSSS
jgi:hypothetical protein